MPAGNFDSPLTINPNGGIDAKGPLELLSDEVMERLYVWVYQNNDDGPEAACIAAQDDADAFSTDRATWSTKPNPIVQGTFIEGKAKAMALAISRVADGSPREEQKRRVFWWEEMVELRRSPDAEAGV